MHKCWCKINDPPNHIFLSSSSFIVKLSLFFILYFCIHGTHIMFGSMILKRCMFTEQTLKSKITPITTFLRNYWKKHSQIFWIVWLFNYHQDSLCENIFMYAFLFYLWQHFKLELFSGYPILGDGDKVWYYYIYRKRKKKKFNHSKKYSSQTLSQAFFAGNFHLVSYVWTNKHTHNLNKNKQTTDFLSPFSKIESRISLK